ncbi:hypothetical protein [Burkholderia ubonensis]|uniref:hypothetical protein n=1 Tax=Burkholderia ubonensis TaxID=101571 RepID=UPI000755104F|nr:hypothetical protein [Burkholderia ubonensis]KVV07399.1 hypothetical protein WK77_16560 [Burkholderia ubonensis]
MSELFANVINEAEIEADLCTNYEDEQRYRDQARLHLSKLLNVAPADLSAEAVDWLMHVSDDQARIAWPAKPWTGNIGYEFFDSE